MSKKSEKFDYIKKKLKLFSKSDFLKLLAEAPLNEKEKNILIDIKDGYSLTELSQKYDLSYSRISQKKRELYELLYDYEMNCVYISNNSTSNKINIEKLVNEKISLALNEKTKQLEQKEALLDAMLEKEEKKRIQKKLNNLDRQLNSRGTKRSEPIIIVRDDLPKNENGEISITKRDLKKKYLPMYVRGEISSKEVCNILGITAGWLSTMKTEYLEKGEDFFKGHKGNIGRIPKNKTSEELKEKICSLYKEKYIFQSMNDFSLLLEKEYKIQISPNTIAKFLKEKGITCCNSDKFIGNSNEHVGTDFLSIMEIMTRTIEKEDLSDIEQFGLVELCELAFSKAYLTLNSLSKKLENTNYRTSYSCISHFIEDNLIDIKDEWTYWNKNHEHFSYIYNESHRLKVVHDIRTVYYMMFKKIEDYIKDAKKKLV